VIPAALLRPLTLVHAVAPEGGGWDEYAGSTETTSHLPARGLVYIRSRAHGRGETTTSEATHRGYVMASVTPVVGDQLVCGNARYDITSAYLSTVPGGGDYWRVELRALLGTTR